MKFIITNAEFETLKKQLASEAVEKYKNTEEGKRVAFDSRRADQDALIAAREESDVYFNFSDPKINVFSVERVQHGTANEHTIIGYYTISEMLRKTNDGTESKKMDQWYLHCSRAQHNKLVMQFERSCNTYRGRELTAKELSAKKQLLQG
jgi:hypothetical protein